MVDLKNEVAGVVAILGFVSLVLTVVGVAGLLNVVLDGGASVVVLVTGDGGTSVAGAAATGSGSVLGVSILAAFGVAGLLATHTAIQSGYFDPEPSRETAAADTGSGPESTVSDATTESETDVEPA